MPVYNGERYISEALSCLTGQTFSDFELIISDNASSDATSVICAEWAGRDPRIRYLRQPENRGALDNFLLVLDQAAGEHFMWAATDDRWDAAWLAGLVSRLDPRACVVFGSVVTFHEDGLREKPVTLKSLDGPATWRMLRYYFWSEWGVKPNVIYGLYRTAEIRRTASQIMGWPGASRYGFDNILVFTLLRSGCLRIEPTVTFYKRRQPKPPESRPAKVLTWSRLRVFAAYIFKVEQIPYLLEHISRTPTGATRWALIAATPLKYVWLIFRGLGPVARLFLVRLRQMMPGPASA